MLSRDVRVLSACGLGMSGDCPHAVRDVRVLSACCQGMSGYCPRAVQGCPGLLSACCPGMAALLACLQCSMMMTTTIVIPNETNLFILDKLMMDLFFIPMHTQQKSAKLRLHIYASLGNTASVQDKYDTIGKKSHSDDGCVREYDDVYTEDASFMQFDAD